MKTNLVCALSLFFVIVFATHALAVCNITETESNNNFPTAQPVDVSCLTTTAGNQISGNISTSDVDVFEFRYGFSAGNIFDVEMQAASTLYPDIAIFDQNGESLLINGYGNYFLNEPNTHTPLSLREPYSTIYLAISHKANSDGHDSGNYQLTVKKLPGQLESPRSQVLLLDFDGAQNVHFNNLGVVNIPAFNNSIYLNQNFPGYLNEIKSRVVQKIRSRFAYYHVDIRTTDQTLPAPPYSVIYFGSDHPAALGMSEGIDEYNVSLTGQAIIFLEGFDIFNASSPSVESISNAIANVTSHETGHLLGLVHTADPDELMDETWLLQDLLEDRSFGLANLLGITFRIGKQNAPKLLRLTVGGDVCTDHDDEDFPPGHTSPSANSIKMGKKYGMSYSNVSGIWQYDACDADHQYIWETYCGTDAANHYTRMSCPANYTCFDTGLSTDGDYCRPLSTCRDSDSSANPPVSGEISLNYRGVLEHWQLSTDSTTFYYDTCTSSTQVQEYYCTSEFNYSSVVRTCPSGKICNNNKCENPPSSCQDECGGRSERSFGCAGTYFTWGCGEANDGDICKDRIYTICPSGQQCAASSSKAVCTSRGRFGRSTASEGEAVELSLGPCSDCAGTQVDFDIHESVTDNPVLTNPAPAIFGQDGMATSYWITENLNTPEDGTVLYFNAALSTDPANPIRSDGDLMVVQPPPNFSVPPQAPSNLRAVPISPNQVRVTWWDNANNEDQYIIWRSLSPNLPSYLQENLPANSYLYDDYNVMQNSTYQYFLEAVNSAGSSTVSDWITVTTPEIPNAPPVITNVRPANGSYISISNPSFSAALTDDYGLYYAIVLLDGSTVASYPLTGLSANISMPGFSLSNGTHSYSITVLDELGKEATATTTFSISVTSSCCSSGGGSCFLAGTPVHMADGSEKPIDLVQAGELILAFDEATKSFKADAVKRAFIARENGYFVINGRIKVTGDHRFYIKGKWKKARKLRAGDSLLTADGQSEDIASVEKKKGEVLVYNLEVNPYHTFVAGGVVVHNLNLVNNRKTK